MMISRLRDRALGVVAALCLASPLGAGGASAWEMNTYQDFIRGRFRGVSLSRDGRLLLAPKLETVFSSDQPVIWSVAQAPDGALYAATGHRGRLFRIDKSGKASVVWTAEEPEIFSLAVDSKGVLYAATSPDGKIYRLDQGKVSEYFAPHTKYIWALAAGPDGALYAGTGDQGKIFRIEPDGRGEVYYDTGQSHVTSLALDSRGRLLAGTEPNGILYRITAKDKAFVLYDAGMPEIRSIVPAADGAVYVAALGGSVARRVQSAQQAVQGGGAGAAAQPPAATITVTADAAQQSPDLKPQPEAPKPPPSAAQPQVTTQFSPLVDMAGVEKSAIYRINADNTVETLWSSKEENVYDLANMPGHILFSTDANGRIYRLSPDRKVTLLVQTNEAETTRLLSDAGRVLAATGNMGRIYRLGDAPSATGTYESPVHDAGAVARWGRLSCRAEGKVTFQTRSGNSFRPDKTWSDWETVPAATGLIPSPNAHYIQWRAEFSASGSTAPVLDSVTVAYLPQNSPPVVRSIHVSTQAVAQAASKPATQAASGAYSITVTDTGDAGVSTSAGTPTQTLSRAASQQINIGWQAEDSDNDRLVYTLYFRGEGEQEWKLLKGNLHENSFLLDGDVLADGKYLFRVTASDREANPPGSAREAELISAPVLIDNTPPAIAVSAPRRTGASVEIEFEAVDAASPLRRCEYSVDAGNWTPLESADGVIDSPRERFVLRLENVGPGEHLVVLRAVDSGNNAGLAKVVLR
jgi:hypothetical protein